MATDTQPKHAKRPVERYLGGIHHLAQPTVDPRATIEFYRDVMGCKITHCVSSRGWRPGHYDYIHMFLDLGHGDNIAMFYYFGVDDPARFPRRGTHHSFAANSLQELSDWADWLEANGWTIEQRNTYEVMSSIYVWDPNGRFLEIACNHRPLNEIDAEDARLTAEALKLAADEKAPSISRMWELKAGLVEQQHGVTLIEPTQSSTPDSTSSRGSPSGADCHRRQADRPRRIHGARKQRRPDTATLSQARGGAAGSLWWTVGTGARREHRSRRSRTPIRTP